METKTAEGTGTHRHGKFVLAWREVLGNVECPYLIRWRLEVPFGSFRVHHWLGPDDDRAFHDHPWWFLTFVLKGGYHDVNPGGCDVLWAPAVRFRRALYRHTVKPTPEAWTVMLTGRRLRHWGFWVDGVRFVKANKYFLSRGHHPCS